MELKNGRLKCPKSANNALEEDREMFALAILQYHNLMVSLDSDKGE